MKVKIFDVAVWEYSVRSFSAAPAAASEVVGRFVPLRGNQAKTASESARQTFPNGVRWISKKQCHFAYRESVFKKKKDWIILGAEFKFKKGHPKELQKIAKEIVKIREQKYWPGLLCPGSFFKNIVVKEIKPAVLRKKFLEKIDKSKIYPVKSAKGGAALRQFNRVNHGKVPTGYLLEEVGAKGMKQGNIKIATHHGNLIYNLGRGKSSEIVKLARILKEKVRAKFGINLDEEIQYI